jgi:hypothetical protein
MTSSKDEMFAKRIMKPIVQLPSGAIYQGEWNEFDNQRDGRGIQIWPNGSRYDGYWKDGMAHGQGRLVHAMGDVYIG